jgi:hypothetical protein
VLFLYTINVTCQVFGKWQKENISHLMVNTLTFPHFLNQDENFFIPQTAANMLVNAADFKFPSKSTFWNKNKT